MLTVKQIETLKRITSCESEPMVRHKHLVIHANVTASRWYDEKVFLTLRFLAEPKPGTAMFMCHDVVELFGVPLRVTAVRIHEKDEICEHTKFQLERGWRENPFDSRRAVFLELAGDITSPQLDDLDTFADIWKDRGAHITLKQARRLETQEHPPITFEFVPFGKTAAITKDGTYFTNPISDDTKVLQLSIRYTAFDSRGNSVMPKMKDDPDPYMWVKGKRYTIVVSHNVRADYTMTTGKTHVICTIRIGPSTLQRLWALISGKPFRKFQHVT